MPKIVKAEQNIELIRKKLKPNLDDYLTDDYQGVVLHTSSIIVAANQWIETILGYRQDELIGMNAWTLFSRLSAQVIMKHLTEKSEEPYRVIAVKKDKTEFEIELKGKDFEIGGEPVRLVLVKIV